MFHDYPDSYVEICYKIIRDATLPCKIIQSYYVTELVGRNGLTALINAGYLEQCFDSRNVLAYQLCCEGEM